MVLGTLLGLGLCFLFGACFLVYTGIDLESPIITFLGVIAFFGSLATLSVNYYGESVEGKVEAVIGEKVVINEHLLTTPFASELHVGETVKLRRGLSGEWRREPKVKLDTGSFYHYAIHYFNVVPLLAILSLLFGWLGYRVGRKETV